MSKFTDVQFGLDHCVHKKCDDCPYASYRVPIGDGIPFCVSRMINDANVLMDDRTREYTEWARSIGVHTCATCVRCSDNRTDNISLCPLEEHYAVPKDGHCHLWIGGNDDA